MQVAFKWSKNYGRRGLYQNFLSIPIPEYNQSDASLEDFWNIYVFWNSRFYIATLIVIFQLTGGRVGRVGMTFPPLNRTVTLPGFELSLTL